MAQPAPNLIRAANDRAALQALVDRGPLTRPEIGALLGLSKPTASQLLSRLQEAGFVVPEGIREGGPGRAAELYRINPHIAHVACFDVTPERIEALVADVTGTVRGRVRLELSDQADRPGSVIDRLRAALTEACTRAGVSHADLHHAVIGVQGALNPATGRLGYAAHLPDWRIPDLLRTLSDGLGVPTSVENDVNLVALAEMAQGVARSHRNFVLLWASDGLGMALVLEGSLYRGATGGAGEVGYMPVPGAPIPHPSERPATYGYHALTGGATVLKVLRSYGFRGATPAAAMQAAARAWAAPAPATAERAASAFRDVANRLATGLAAVVAVIDPDLVVLAGDVLLAGGHPLRELVEQELHTMTIPKPPLRLSTLEGNPVLSGALERAVTETRDRLFSAAVPL